MDKDLDSPWRAWDSFFVNENTTVLSMPGVWCPQHPLGFGDIWHAQLSLQVTASTRHDKLIKSSKYLYLNWVCCERAVLIRLDLKHLHPYFTLFLKKWEVHSKPCLPLNLKLKHRITNKFSPNFQMHAAKSKHSLSKLLIFSTNPNYEYLLLTF